jgi:hypothetical protein
MVRDMEASVILCALFRGFSTQRPQVREEVNASAIQVLSVVYQLSRGCTCEKR